MDAEFSVFRRKFCIGFFLYQKFMLQTTFDDFLHRNDRITMFFGKFQQFGRTHHRTIFAHDLTAKSALFQPGKSHKIYRRLRMAGTFQHTAFARLQREHMARSAEILRFCLIFHRFHRRKRSLKRGNSGRCIDMIDGHGKCGRVIIRIYFHHLFQSQFFTIFCTHRHTNQPLGKARHRIDIFRRRMLCRTDQISFVFAVRIVNDQNQFALFQIFECLI